jgi:hypothetical protein
MGQLRPGATYTYEREGSVTFATDTETGERKPIGWDHRTDDGRPILDHLMESKMWGEIHRAAKTNPALQVALDRAIMIYRLSKDKPL